MVAAMNRYAMLLVVVLIAFLAPTCSGQDSTQYVDEVKVEVLSATTGRLTWKAVKPVLVTLQTCTPRAGVKQRSPLLQKVRRAQHRQSNCALSHLRSGVDAQTRRSRYHRVRRIVHN